MAEPKKSRLRKDRWRSGLVTIYLESGGTINFRGRARTLWDPASDEDTAVDYEIEACEVLIRPALSQVAGITVRK